MDELKSFLEFFRAELFKDLDLKSNVLILFKAEMGSGKTTFTRELVRSFDDSLQASSPSFIGMHHYSSSELDFYHYDLYQVALNLEELMEILDSEKKKLVLIEWSEKLNTEDLKLLEQRSDSVIKKISIEVNNDEKRIFSLN